jgi:hypothetical protein
MYTIPLPEISKAVLAKIKSKTIVFNGCYFWQGCCDDDGRGTIMIEYRRYKVSRLIWFITHGVDPNELYVCHKWHKPRCIKPDHLYLDAQSGNIQTAVDLGTRFQPDNRKLTDKDKAEIKFKKMFGTSVPELASQYKVCTATIYQVLRCHETVS